MGVILGASCESGFFMIFAFCISLVYMLIIVVGWAVSREVFTGRAQIIVEIVIAVVQLIATILLTISNAGKALIILTIIVGYILATLFMITAYTGS